MKNLDATLDGIRLRYRELIEFALESGLVHEASEKHGVGLVHRRFQIVVDVPPQDKLNAEEEQDDWLDVGGE